MGCHGFRRGLLCRVDPKGEHSLPLHPAYPEPVERQQEGPDQQGRTGEGVLWVLSETADLLFVSWTFVTLSVLPVWHPLKEGGHQRGDVCLNSETTQKGKSVHLLGGALRNMAAPNTGLNGPNPLLRT